MQDLGKFYIMVKPIITWTLREGEDTILASGGESFLH